MESHRRFPAKFATRRRPGYAVFVTNVSKRIHWSSLCEAFQVYGSVIDTFIAYKNLRRRGKPTTFAFVRFGQQHEARAAADLGDGRIMDGFKIRVFLDKEFSGEKVNPKVATANHRRGGFALRDLRSFNDVVMGVRKFENKRGSHGLDSGFRNTKDCPLSEEDCRVIIVDDKSDGLHEKEPFQSSKIHLDEEEDVVRLNNNLLGNDSPPYVGEPETHVAQSHSSGVDLHEVPIISIDGLPSQRLNTSYGPTTMCFENEKIDDSISNASRLQEVQIEIADKSLGAMSEPVYPSALNNANMFGASGESQFFGGRSIGLRAGLDKFIWKANPQKSSKMLRSSFKGTRGKNRGSHLGLGI
ncbi:hypothetical protein V6N11_024913 [Hibiscus sabdariffa]|uniref:RRM domain-containing protein n=1 Tax=Hibiscus sabdariffa TaxID=183260 RepID=A0ABR2QNH3_9ROSI